MARRLRVARERIDVIPRGRDARRLGRRSGPRRAAARSELGLAADEPLVLCVGNHTYAKGLDVAVAAFARIHAEFPRSRLFVCGREGPTTPRLRALADELDLTDSVALLGTRADIPELLCAADLFVFPSRWEGMPGALIEAMALEVPIVASDIPPVREVLGGEGCGELVVPDNVAALAERMARTLNVPDVTRTERAHTRFLEQFTIERVAEQMLAFYERALGG